MSTARRAALVAPAILAIGAAGIAVAVCPAPASGTVARVIAAADGDTLLVEIRGERRAVDLLGVKAPAASSCQGKRARSALSRLVPTSARVRIMTRVPAAGRFLAEVRMPGTAGPATISRAVVAAGNARARLAGPRSRFRAEYVSAERAARGHARGLWSERCATAGNEPRPPGETTGDPSRPPPPPPPGPGETDLQRIDRLLGGVALSLNEELTQDGLTETTDTRIDLCANDTFKYRQTYTVEGVEDTTSVAGTWQVQQDAGLNAPVIDYTNPPPALNSMKVSVTEAGSGLQVLLDDKPYTTSAAICG